MNEVLRQERKYLIDQATMYRLSFELGQVMHMDSHGSSTGYIIRSLYFDSLMDRDYFEKGEGVEIRRKIRLRNYGPDCDFAMLEMKQKQGANQKKRSLRLEREEALRLSRGDLSVLLTKHSGFADECFYVMHQHAYRPKCVVTYQRKAFVAKENSTRITFDHHIMGTETSYNIFDPKINENYILDPSLAVLEVKFNGFLLGYIKKILNDVDKSETSVSKYYLGRSLIMDPVF